MNDIVWGAAVLSSLAVAGVTIALSAKFENVSTTRVV